MKPNFNFYTTLKIIKGGETFIIHLLIKPKRELSIREQSLKIKELATKIGKDIKIKGDIINNPKYREKINQLSGIIFVLTVINEEEVNYYYNELKNYIYQKQ